MTETDIEFRGVSKTYGEVLAVDRVDLAIPKGAFVSLLGPSGCGKTTSLRIMAGFEQPSAGEVEISGLSVVGVPAYRRPVNMVFQNYALFPHLTVFDNVAFGLRQLNPKPAKRELEKQVAAALELVRLSGFGGRHSSCSWANSSFLPFSAAERCFSSAMRWSICFCSRATGRSARPSPWRW
jgi:spermidine/putrescine transport system ATP-binding protein